MEPRQLLDALIIAERLKDTTRHCYTTKGRHESVAEHSWMTSLMVFFMQDEFKEADMNKVMKMCIIHDLGEAFTGDIPTFLKTKDHEKKEEELLNNWIKSLPENYIKEMTELYQEMSELKTLEAKIFKAIDKLEALIQHNMSDISTWIPEEYELNQTYAHDQVAFSKYLMSLRQEILEDTLQKIAENEDNLK